MKRQRWELRIILFIFCIIIITCLTNCQDTGQNDLNNLQFDEFDIATRIEIHQYKESVSPTILIEDDADKIQLAREFIRNYPDGWKRPPFTTMVGVPIEIVFFNSDEYLGQYGIGDDFLTYNQKYVIRLNSDAEINILLEKLGIPEK